MNARYTELAYSGAEDAVTTAGVTRFGGEVVGGSGGSPDDQLAHTGYYSYQAAAGQKALVYRAQIGRDVDAGRPYRLQVWAHANAASGKLYASLNNTRIAESGRTSVTTKKAGDWYLLSLLVTIPAGTSGQFIEFGCVNDNTVASANFDDFRVAPLTAEITSNVYDPHSNNLLYSLDNDNLFTRYEYTPVGRVRRVYKESFDGMGSASTAQKLIKEYEYNYARLTTPTWLSVEYACGLDQNGNSTGQVKRRVVDVNPLSNPPAPSHWEPVGQSVACMAPVCATPSDGRPVRLRNNVCEYAEPAGSECNRCVGNSNNGWQTVFHWKWPDGSDAGDTSTGCLDVCVSFRQLAEKGIRTQRLPSKKANFPDKAATTVRAR